MFLKKIFVLFSSIFLLSVFSGCGDKVLAQEKPESNQKTTKELKVLDWGPKDEVPGLIKAPVFFVTFSESVKELSALGSVITKSDIISIEPEIKGRFRWIGSRSLYFYAEQTLDPSQIYTITVNDKAERFKDFKFTGEKVFKTKAQDLAIVDINPGYDLYEPYYYNEESGVIPDRAKNCLITINGFADKEKILECFSVSVDGKNAGYEIVPVKSIQDTHGFIPANDRKIKKENENDKKPIYEKVEKSNQFLITIKKELKKNQKIEIVCKSGKTVTNREYKTLLPFKLMFIEYYSWSREVSLRFNQPVNFEVFEKFIKIEPKVEIKKDNVHGSGLTAVCSNLNLEYDAKYTVKISSDLKDVYGQKITGDLSKTFKTGKAASFINLSEEGEKVMAKKKLIPIMLTHQNIYETYYSAKSVSNPFEKRKDFDESFKYENIKKFSGERDNKVHNEIIDIRPYLRDGYGFVKVGYKSKSSEWGFKNKYFTENFVYIQVTDLGVSFKASYNKVAAMVKRISDDSAVEKAFVVLYVNDGTKSLEANASENAIAKGFTDKNGFVIFDIEESRRLEKAFTDREELCIMAQKDNDRSCIKIGNYSKWWGNYSSNSIGEGYLLNTKHLFMFTDRGIYRPGETVSFRGIARLQTRNGYEPLSGKYKVVFSKLYRLKEKYGELEGTYSECGGLSGSFRVPDDVKPDDYEIVLLEDDKVIGRETFKVSYFEKVKFSASVSADKKEYISGETVNAVISASYLAGGSLTGSTYKARWNRNLVYFMPPSREAEKYVFGPIDHDYAGFSAEDSGSLNQSGEAKISLELPDSDGYTYSYKVNVDVTDVSNQRIFAGKSVTVHPGLFYIGVAKKLTNGFPKAKEKLDIPFALFKPDGETADIRDVREEIKYNITRETSEIIYGDVYNGFNHTAVSKLEDIADGTIKPSVKGSVSFTPEKAGYYKIQFETKDKDGNLIKTQKGFYVTGSDYSRGRFDFNKIELTADKEIYKPGEKAKILLNSPLEKGDYIITVERDKNYTAEIRHIEESCSVLEIDVKEEYVPCVYVTVSSYITGNEKNLQDEEGLKPCGCYGVCKIKTELDVVSFDVEVVKEKESFRPGENISLKLKALKDGKPVNNAELSLIITDRAVTDVIGYRIKNPVKYFYDEFKFRWYACGYDLRDYLIYKNNSNIVYEEEEIVKNEAFRLEKSKMASDTAFDESVSQSESLFFDLDAKGFVEEEPVERKDFNPTAAFIPLVVTDKNGEATVNFKLPDSLTTYRVTVVGVSKNNFAFDESEMVVNNPVNVQAFQPRRLRTGDTAEAGVIITNNDAKKKKVKVTLTAREPQGDYESDKLKGLKTVRAEAEIKGETYKEITVEPGKTVPVYFEVNAKKEGWIELVYEVKCDVLNERLVSPILIEKSFVYETVALYGQTGNNPDKKENISSKEIIVLPSGDGLIEITLDPSQLGLLGESVNYVFDYPYGCLEQQSARILPLVIFGDYIDTFGLENKVTDVRKFVKTWFSEVKNEQHTSGGFPYWPGRTYDSPYVSLRFAHLYALAKQHGYTDEEIGYDLKKLISYITPYIKKDDGCNAFTAYACYVYSAINNNALEKKLDELYKYCADDLNYEYKSLTMLCYTALAYQNKGDKASIQKADKLCSILKRYIIESGRSISLGNVPCGNFYISGMYDNNTEGLAVMLELFVKREPQSEFTGKILNTLLLSQKHGYWQSTATTAKVFNAVDELIKSRKLEKLDFVSSAVISQNGSRQTLIESKFKGAGEKPVKQIFDFTGKELSELERDKAAELEFTKNGRGTLYYTTVMKYAVSPEVCESRDEGLDVSYIITDEDKNEVEPNNKDGKIYLESGKTYEVTVNVVTSQSRQYVALKIPVASGTEIVDSSLITGSGASDFDESPVVNYSRSKRGAGYTSEVFVNPYRFFYDRYEYFYDNEAQYFNDYMHTGTYTYKIKIRASRRGEYKVPPVHAECMYEPEVFGRSNGSIFVIK